MSICVARNSHRTTVSPSWNSALTANTGSPSSVCPMVRVPRMVAAISASGGAVAQATASTSRAANEIRFILCQPDSEFHSDAVYPAMG